MSRKKKGVWSDIPGGTSWKLPLRSIRATILLQDEAQDEDEDEDEHSPVFYAYLGPNGDGDVVMSMDLTSVNGLSEAKLKAMKGFRNKLTKAVKELDQLIMELPVQETMDS